MKSSLYVGIVAAVGVLIAVAATPSAFAIPEQSCFGMAGAYMGTTGQMGDHSSSFDEPRMGIGNVAEFFGLTVWQLGAFLLSAITGGAVTCP